MDGQRQAATVHLAVQFRIFECSLYGNRDTQADVAVSGAGVDIRLEIGLEHQVHAPVTGFCMEIGFARYANFNVKVPRIMPEREAPAAGDARRQLDFVAVLTSVDAEVFS